MYFLYRLQGKYRNVNESDKSELTYKVMLGQSECYVIGSNV